MRLNRFLGSSRTNLFLTDFTFPEKSVLLNKPIFKHSDKLFVVAQSHSNDMVSYNFYSHTSLVRGKKTMSDDQIKNFIMYYERLTKHMLNILPKTADTVISIDKKHRLRSIRFN